MSGFARKKSSGAGGNDAFKSPDAASVVYWNNKLGNKLHQMFI